MKLSVYMFAFILSAAIHVGALTSNLLHVNASSVSENRARTVKLHIVPTAVRMPSAQPLEEAEEIIERPRIDDSEITEGDRPELPLGTIPPTPGVRSPEIVLTEMLTAVRMPVYREQIGPPDTTAPSPVMIPDPPPAAATSAVRELREEWPDSRPDPSDGSENKNAACDGCSATLASLSSLIPDGPPVTGRETGPTSPAMITLVSKPKYPRYSRMHKQEGKTVLSVEILPDGTLGHVEIISSSGYRRLDQAAVKGMQEAELVPAMMDGKSVASVKRISIRFDLEDWGE